MFIYAGATKTNYEQMKTVHQKFAARGFMQLGFPCDQFFGDEPGSDADIKTYVEENFGGTGFVDLFSKIDVNGDNAHPIYKWLKSQQHGFLTDEIKWNFSKFLIDRNGRPVKRYAPTTEPKDIEDDIAFYLDSKQEL
jgi:glutathione peroxidase-family protein